MRVFQLPVESHVNNNSAPPQPPNSLTEEQREEAEALKTDGETPPQTTATKRIGLFRLVPVALGFVTDLVCHE